MIPVMIIGIFISGKKYGWQEFGIAGAVTTGCVAFVLSGVGNFLKFLWLANLLMHVDIQEVAAADSDDGDSVYGLGLMGAYLFSDAFTSTFQEKLFKGYEMSTYNQMLYVNLCSAIISIISEWDPPQHFLYLTPVSFQHSHTREN